MNKERLRKYRDIVDEQKQLEAELEELEVSVYSPRIPQLTGMPSAHSSKSGSAQERSADATEKLRAHYRNKIAELHEEQLAIEKAIDSLEPRLRMLLRYKYIDGCTWEEVCVKIGYEWAQTHRLHARALQLLEQEIE